MQINSEDIESAAILIYFGMNTSLKPHEVPEYQKLIEKYKFDSNFRVIVKSISSGLHLKVLAVESFGVVLSPETNSLFSFKLADFGLNSSSDKRSIWGIILLGLASYFYPKNKSFDRDGINEVKTITAETLDKFIRIKCQNILTNLNYSDTLSDNPELEKMFREYLSIPQVISEVQDNRSTTIYFIKRVFRYLIDQGLALKDKNDDKNCKILPHFRLLVEELTTNDQFKLFISKQGGSS